MSKRSTALSRSAMGGREIRYDVRSALPLPEPAGHDVRLKRFSNGFDLWGADCAASTSEQWRCALQRDGDFQPS
jgi:hypothetical protein